MPIINVIWDITPDTMRCLDRRQAVESQFPVDWNPLVGDHIMWECGHNNSGYAEIISVGTEVSTMPVPLFDDDLADEDAEVPLVDCVTCILRKLS